MEEKMEYRDYTGSVEFSSVDNKYFGKVMGIEDQIMYEAESRTELIQEFEISVDIYLLLCNEAGKKPDTVSGAN